MMTDSRPDGDDRGDYRYFGPFGAPPSGQVPAGSSSDFEPTAPLNVGQWSYGQNPTTSGPAQPAGPYSSPNPASAGTAAPPGWQSPHFPAPSGVPPLNRPGVYGPTAAGFAPSSRERRPVRGGAMLLAAALTALVVGAAAGFGGFKLAQQSGPGVQGSAVPSAASPSDPAATAPRATTAPAPLPPLSSQSNTVEVAKRVLPSSVMIQVGTNTSGATGSGFVLDTDGRIMTNNHVVAAADGGGRIAVVFADGSKTSATLVGRSPSYDLAVIKVHPSRPLTPIQIGDSSQTQVGETVIAIGSPLALPGTVTQGIVSANNRPVVVKNSENADSPSAYIDAIQTDAPINPGNSGGPLVDARARVVGVNSAILTLGSTQGQSGSIGLGFAIPINQAMQIGRLLIANGKATYPVIGANVSDSENGDGVKLSAVESGGPAAAAGLRQGDLVTSIDGLPVSNIERLIVTIRTHRPGERVTLDYQRGSGASRKASVTLGSKEG